MPSLLASAYKTTPTIAASVVSVQEDGSTYIGQAGSTIVEPIAFDQSYSRIVSQREDKIRKAADTNDGNNGSGIASLVEVLRCNVCQIRRYATLGKGLRHVQVCHVGDARSGLNLSEGALNQDSQASKVMENRHVIHVQTYEGHGWGHKQVHGAL